MTTHKAGTGGHRRRRVAIDEEDATTGKLGEEFTGTNSGAVTNSEVRALLERVVHEREMQKREMPGNDVFKKTQEYVAATAVFEKNDVMASVRGVLKTLPELTPFEATQVANLVPETAEEAKALIPTLSRIDDDTLHGVLTDIVQIRRFQ